MITVFWEWFVAGIAYYGTCINTSAAPHHGAMYQFAFETGMLRIDSSLRMHKTRCDPSHLLA